MFNVSSSVCFRRKQMRKKFEPKKKQMREKKIELINIWYIE